MSTTTPGRGSVPAQAQPPQAARTIDLTAPAPAPAPAAPAAAGRERTRTDTVRDAVHAGTCVLAGVLITTGFALDPPGTDADSSAGLFAAVADHPDRFYAGNLLGALGLAMMAAVGLAVLRLVRGRGRVLATVGGLLMMIGGAAAGAGVFMYGAVVSAMAEPGRDAAAMAGLQDDVSGSLQAGVPFFIGFPGLMLGLVVCAAALAVSRATPRWVPAVLVLGTIAVMALGSTDVSSVGDVLLTAGCTGVAISLWRAVGPRADRPA